MISLQQITFKNIVGNAVFACDEQFAPSLQFLLNIQSLYFLFARCFAFLVDELNESILSEGFNVNYAYN